MKALKLFSVFTGLVILASTAVHADDFVPKTRVMASMKLAKEQNAMGDLVGIGFVNYQSEKFYIGGAVFTGQLSNGVTGNYNEGGLLAGYVSGHNDIAFIGNILIGAGVGNTSTTSGGGFILEPNFGADFKLGDRTRGVVDLGYSYNSAATAFSAIILELRVDFLN